MIAPGVSQRFAAAVIACVLASPVQASAEPGKPSPSQSKHKRKPRAERRGHEEPRAAAPPPQSSEASPESEAKEAARNLAREALELMHQSRWAEARSLLSRAYALVPAPTIALLEGKALEQMGRLLEARERYDTASRISATESSEAFVAAAKEATERLAFLDRRIPKIAIVLEQDEQDSRIPLVSLDGGPLSREQWAAPRSVNPGEHVVSASLGGDVSVEDHVLVKEAETKQVYLRLRRPVPIAGWTPPLVAERPQPSNPTRTWAVVALGAGVAGLATGVTAGIIMLNAKSSLDNACSQGCPASMEDDLSRFRTARLVSTVGYGVGAVGLATFGSLLLFGPRERSPEPVGTVRIGIGPSSAYLRGSF